MTKAHTYILILQSCNFVMTSLQEMVSEYVHGDQLITALEAEREFVMTPKMFMHTINRICLQQVRVHHHLLP